MSEAGPQQLEAFRDYLLLMGRLQVSPALAAKVDLSGVVQQTIWEANQAQSEVGRDGVPSYGADESAQLVWLRTLFANNLRDEIRKATAERRDYRREVALDAALEASSARIGAFLASQHSSPSQKAIRFDELTRLVRALSELPDDQRQAIELHHLSGLPLADVSQQLGRTREATAALLYRALKKLRQRLK